MQGMGIFSQMEIMLVALIFLAIKGFALIAVVYVGGRLAIRHERRITS